MAGAATVTDKMLFAASEALAASLTEEERGEGRVFPRVKRIREVALHVVRALELICLHLLSINAMLFPTFRVRVWHGLSETVKWYHS